jgi:Dolichyl-phosphate-mannose-protein mannosyltransferase
MLLKILYLLLHYAHLSVFILSFWGMGYCLLNRIFKLEIHDSVLGTTLAITIGQGIFIVILQCLAISGVLKNLWLSTVLISSCVLAIFQIRRTTHLSFARLTHTWTTLSRSEIVGLVFILAWVFPTILEPLRPPWPGDELHYHLPHAQQWALSGKLTVNEWLRYPWFPYNYDLLYASAYVIYGDVFTHLFNALAGWLIAIITYQIGKRHFNHVAACIAVFIWFHMNRGEFGRTYVDMGTSLYVLTGSLTFFWWIQTPNDRRWLAVSAFLIGIAAGSKYQVLIFLPLLGLAMLWIDRRPKTVLIALISFFIPCIYWYARNAILTGDPFNPIGGKIFGFTDWNLGDYVLQFEDLKHAKAWPTMLLWPAALALWNLASSARALNFAVTALCLYFFMVWVATSHYPRYLMPVVPWLALLAGENWGRAGNWIATNLTAALSKVSAKIIRNIFWSLIFITAFLSSASFSIKYWFYISPTKEDRNILMRQQLKGYALLEYLNKHNGGRIYNIGLSDATYYAPYPIWGDVFGPWRFRDIIAPEAVKFSKELRKRNFNKVIVTESMGRMLESSPLFKENFSIEYESDGFKVYRVENLNNEY